MLTLFSTMKPWYGAHELAWDGSIAVHHPVGRVQCLKCRKQWPWRQRGNMKQQQPCEGWVSMPLADTNRREVLRRLGLPLSVGGARRRIRGKTSPDVPLFAVPQPSSSSSSTARHVASPSSTSLPAHDEVGGGLLQTFHFDDMG